MSNLIKIIFTLLLLGFIVITIIDDNTRVLVCAETSTVTEILSIQYRSATIKLADGTTAEVNQATLKPGDSYCKRYERKQ